MTENAIVAIDQDSQITLPAHVVETRKAYQQEALAEGTRRAYRNAVALFTAWCDEHGRQVLPASVETIADWAVALADGTDGRAPRARRTVGLYVSGVVSMQRLAGYKIDTKDPVLALTMKGIGRSKAKTEIPKKAAPLMDRHVLKMLQEFDPSRAVDARDGALLGVGWAAALRRSELVGLDYGQLGEGAGFVRIDERGIEITLMVSKASQDAAVTVAIPDEAMPAAKRWLEGWITLANIQPGEPVFRPVDRFQRVSPDRLYDGAVSVLVKKRVRDYALAEGKTKEEAAAMMQAFSGHSMRSGFVTSAVDKEKALVDLAPHTRHKSLSTLQGYVRNRDQWKRSPLFGVGF